MNLEEWAAYEQACLWSELDEQIRRAINGHWSMGAAGAALRIVGVAKIIGPTPYDEVSWMLVGGGVYEALLDIAGVKAVLPTDEEWARLSDLMYSHGGNRAMLREKYASTVEAMRSPQETAFILDGQ